VSDGGLEFVELPFALAAAREFPFLIANVHHDACSPEVVVSLRALEDSAVFL
jgi:hypothetical protein